MCRVACMHSEFSRVMLQCVLLVEAQIMWSPAAKNSCRDIYLRPFSAESSWTAGASKSARQLSATAPCINPRHFELGIPTLHVPTIYFKAKQNQACHYDVPPQTLARWKSRRVVIILPTIPLLWVRLPSPCRRHRPKRNKPNQPLLPI